MAFMVFKTVYLLLALIAIPQVFAGPHYNYGKRHSKCKKKSSVNPSSTPYGMGGTPTLYPTSTPADVPPTPSTSPALPASCSPPTSSPPAASSPPPASSSVPSSSPSPSPAQDLSTGTDSLEAESLQAHNTAREAHGAQDLVWNQDLANYAQNWVNKCNFVHSGGPYGENLYAATGTATVTDAVNGWMSEASSYDPNNPMYSHFTQVVWKSTTQVGCAIANCSAGSIFPESYGESQFISCNYNPAGNVEGEFPENVQP